ncbi:MAG: hypothetical protein AB1473_14955 [Thermodesulfobacteriota bacterium]
MFAVRGTDAYIFQIAICVMAVALLGGCSQSPILTPLQAIPTHHASCWNSFTINEKTYLAVANHATGTQADYERAQFQDARLRCVIYEWNGKEFRAFQDLPSERASSIRSFVIGSDTYLAVTPHWGTHVKVYKFLNGRFEEAFGIPAQCPRDVACFSIGEETYLAVTHHYDQREQSPNICSAIHKWNGASFEKYQDLPTAGAMRWAAFTIDGNRYLAVANNYDGHTHNIESTVFRWNGVRFDPIQQIPTKAATSCESIAIDGKTYLAISNNFDDSTHNIDSKIYEWNGNRFDEIQSIPTLGGVYFKSFKIKETTYLAIANHYDSSKSSYNTLSKLYKWSGRSFLEVQSVPTHCGCFWESIVVSGNHLLVVANAFDGSTYDIDSVVYKFQE